LTKILKPVCLEIILSLFLTIFLASKQTEKEQLHQAYQRSKKQQNKETPAVKKTCR
jgi:hypothetical protein